MSVGHLALQQHPPFKHGVEITAWTGLEGDLEREVVAHCSGCPKKCVFSKEFGKKTNRERFFVFLCLHFLLCKTQVWTKKKKKSCKTDKDPWKKSEGLRSL